MLKDNTTDIRVETVVQMLKDQLKYRQHIDRNVASICTLFGFVGDLKNSNGFIGSILRDNIKADEIVAGGAANATRLMAEDMTRDEQERFYTALVSKIARLELDADQVTRDLLDSTINLIINGISDRDLAERLCELLHRKTRE